MYDIHFLHHSLWGEEETNDTKCLEGQEKEGKETQTERKEGGGESQ